MAKIDPSVTLATNVTVGNADVEWDTFDSNAYFDHNYRNLRFDDAEIIKIVADFFAVGGKGHWRDRAIDVGSGANLYPAMTMLPYAAEVTLYERAHSNRRWLEHELAQPSPSWEKEFWPAVAADREEYARILRPLDLLHRRARVTRGSVYSLAPGQYDMGTMFFVAESITTRTDEFRRAAQSFVNSLKPRAPFAAAFMRNSSGYIVGNQHFPACSVDEADVTAALAPVARNVQIFPVDSNDLREGYCGMMVATGFKN